MGLNIGVGQSAKTRSHEPSMALEDDGYFWFLWPHFDRLSAETGQTMDLYGDASFSGESLTAIERALALATSQVENQPKSWEVSIGTTSAGEVYRTVWRRQFLDLIAEFSVVITRCRVLGQPLVCIGD